MVNFKIITNNPMVEEKYSDMTEFMTGKAGDVFIAARNLVHKGAVLLNHPLSGSIPPGVSPYKSLMISRGTSPKQIDFKSLNLIEEALRALKKPPENMPGYDERTLLDFQTVDLDLLDSGIYSLCPWKVK